MKMKISNSFKFRNSDTDISSNLLESIDQWKLSQIKYKKMEFYPRRWKKQMDVMLFRLSLFMKHRY